LFPRKLRPTGGKRGKRRKISPMSAGKHSKKKKMASAHLASKLLAHSFEEGRTVRNPKKTEGQKTPMPAFISLPITRKNGIFLGTGKDSMYVGYLMVLNKKKKGREMAIPSSESGKPLGGGKAKNKRVTTFTQGREKKKKKINTSPAANRGGKKDRIISKLPSSGRGRDVPKFSGKKAATLMIPPSTVEKKGRGKKRKSQGLRS